MFLREHAVGQVVARVDVAAISALKTYDPPVTSLAGLTVTGVERHGKFLDLDVDGLHLVIHLARAGLAALEGRAADRRRPSRGKSPLALRVHLDDGSGFDLTEAGTARSGSRSTSSATRPRSRASRGSARTRSTDDFTRRGARRDPRRARARSRSRACSRDQSVIAGIGNAYSDEILHVAKMSPFKPAPSLDRRGERARLYDAIRVDARRRGASGRAGWPPATSRRRRSPGMRVHGRTGLALPGLRRHRARGVLRRLVAAVLPDLPDRRQAARRPPAVAAAQVAGPRPCSVPPTCPPWPRPLSIPAASSSTYASSTSGTTPTSPARCTSR